MTVFGKRYLAAFAATAALALGLYGCGGGGGGAGMMPGDGDGMVIEYGHGLVAGPLASPTASSAADSRENLDDASTTFAPVSAPVKITSDAMGQAGVVVLEDNEQAYLESITYDGAGGYSIVYVVDGQKTQVDFEAADWIPNYG